MDIRSKIKVMLLICTLGIWICAENSFALYYSGGNGTGEGRDTNARYWVAATNSNWNNSANWSNLSFAPGGFSVPTSQIAVLNTGSSKCTVDVNNVSVHHLIMDSGYTGEFVAGSGNLNISGGFIRSAGTFTHSNGNVSFVDSAEPSIIFGNTTFYDLTSTTAGKQIYFTAGSNQTIANTLTLTGTKENLITLRSTSDGSKWNVTFPNKAQTVNYIDVKDADANTNKITCYYSKSLGNNNANWVFIRPLIGGGIIPAEEEGEITADDNPLTKIVIPANTIHKTLKYTVTKVGAPSTGTKGAKTPVTAYEFKAEDATTGETINNLGGLVSIRIGISSVGGIVQNTGIQISEASTRFGIGYWDGLNWSPIGSKVIISGTDVIVESRTAHFSQYGMIVKVGAVQVTVSPNPVTPRSSDSRFNRITFLFENTDAEEVELTIWDITGVMVRRITESGVVSLIWDCRNEYGEMIEGGVYIYQLKVGNSMAGKGTIIVAY